MVFAMGAGATYYATIGEAFSAWGGFNGQSHRRSRAEAAVLNVVVLSATRHPRYYVTGAGRYVGVEGDDGHRIMRVERAAIWASCCPDGFRRRTSLPDRNLPYELKLA
jgi:hypothetical protein